MTSCGGFSTQHHGCGGAGQGGGGLDAVAALADEPEEAVRRRIKTNHRRAIGGEGAEAAPGMVEMVDLNCRGSHQALDAFGDGHVIGIGIVGINRRGVGGGDHHLAALRLGVPGFANVGDQGKIGNAGNAINRNDADGAALGLQADWLYAALLPPQHRPRRRRH